MADANSTGILNQFSIDCVAHPLMSSPPRSLEGTHVQGHSTTAHRSGHDCELLAAPACATGGAYSQRYPVADRNDRAYYDRGFREGLDAGADDARRGRSYDVRRHGEYRDNSRGNDRGDLIAFRQGFESGYGDGYRSYARAGIVRRDRPIRRHQPIRSIRGRRATRAAMATATRPTAVLLDAFRPPLRRTAIATDSMRARKRRAAATATTRSARSDTVKATTTTTVDTDRARTTSATIVRRFSRAMTPATVDIDGSQGTVIRSRRFRRSGGCGRPGAVAARM